MIKLLTKEIKLSSSILSWLFIAFGLLTFVPGYPILCGIFFITLGIFQSYRTITENNDILYSVLLPIAKRDVVAGKYLFTILIEICGFIVSAAATLFRMTVLSNQAIYRNNALMNANPFFLGVALVIFGLFNFIFVGGFFKTAYRFTKPFVQYTIVAFITIFLSEALHYIPGFEALNSFEFDHIDLQLICLLCGMLLFVVLTVLSCRLSMKRFEKIDL